MIDRVYKKLKQNKVDNVLANCSETVIEPFWHPKTAIETVEKLKDHRAKKNYAKLKALIPYFLEKFPEERESIERCKALPFDGMREALLFPTVHAWIRAMHGHSTRTPVLNIEGKELPIDLGYCEALYQLAADKKKTLSIQSQDRWFRLSLGSNIILEHTPDTLDQGVQNLHTA